MLEKTMRIATWNVNSLRIRLAHVTRWLDEHRPDVLLLQETKVADADFPFEPFLERGYLAAIHGQKSYNGVAILSRHPLTAIRTGLADLAEPEQCRLLGATVTPLPDAAGAADTDQKPLRVFSAYLPNGGEVGSDKFAYKENYYKRLSDYMKKELQQHPRLVIGGDFNIAADDRDADDPVHRAQGTLFTPAERAWLASFREQTGLADALRLIDAGSLEKKEKTFSWWDYRDLGLQRNRGMRIDYLFVSPALAPQVKTVAHHKPERQQPQPSDHIPVLMELS